MIRWRAATVGWRGDWASKRARSRKPLFALRDMPLVPKSKGANMKIEDLDASEQCLAQLKRAAFTKVEEIVEFLDDNWGTMQIKSQWLLSNCFDELLDQLNVMGFRLIHEGQNWDGTLR